jgi:diguanylate cyclase (GGDEF)-like protein
MIAESHARLRGSYYGAAAALVGSIATCLAAALTDDGPRPWIAAAGLLAAFALGLLRHMRRQLLGRLGAEMERARIAARDTQGDEVTGALTRRAFFRAAEAALEPGRRGALLVFDMDHFKQINDAHGHEMGDAALRHLAAAVEQIAPDAVFGRLGGDEFALLVLGEAAADPARLARCLLAELARPMHFAGRQLRLSASIGIAAAEGTLDEMIGRADLALYEAKRSGRSRATLFDAEMLRERRHQRFVERELRAAILLNELELAYQPIVGTDGRLRACEALVRWRHPARGLIPPSDFIPVAERSLLIDALGAWVLKRACADAAGVEDMRIGVNFSASQFRRDDVVAMVAQMLAETGLAPDRLVIEVTESVAMDALPDVRARVETLRGMGVRISLDDFGAGHCGFSNLRSFPFNSVKIDRSFVQRLGASPADDVVVAALGRVADALGMAVVAEGIETPEQLALTRAAGCTLFQGYHIARPQPWAAIRRDWFDASPARRLAGAA